MTKYYSDPLDFPRMRLDGITFLIARASIGFRKDPAYDIWLEECERHRFAFESYHLLFPGLDAAEQARFFLDVRRPGLEFDWLDVEPTSQGIPSADEVHTFIDEYKRLGGGKIGIYTNYSTWTYNVKIHDPSFGDEHPLWLAAWDATEPLVPFPWVKYKYWQYRVDHHSKVDWYDYKLGENSSQVDRDIVGD